MGLISVGMFCGCRCAGTCQLCDAPPDGRDGDGCCLGVTPGVRRLT